MARRERVASTRRAFTHVRKAQRGTVVVTARASANRVSSSSSLPPPPLESLFDSAPESWLALHIERSAEPSSLQRLAVLAGDFSPRVSLEPPDAVLLEVRGSFRLFGGAQPLCRQLLERCAAAQIGLRWALAPTPLSALVLARAGQGVIVLARDRLVGLLSPLPLAVLQWSDATLARLDSVGVRTLGAALRLPRAGFARRFGREALLDLDRLTGAAPEPRRAFFVHERFRVRIDPGCELGTVQGVLHVLSSQLAELEDFLRTRQSGIDLLMLRLRHRDIAPTRVNLRLATVELQAARFGELLALQLSRLVLPAPVVLCELRSGALRPFVTHSAAIWRPGEHGGGERGGGERGGVALRESSALIDRLRARLGGEAVYGLCLVPEHRPENAWRVTEPTSIARAPDALLAGAMRHGLARRPLWLLHEPEVLPWALECMQLLEGPERIETGWWDGREVARDYYVARDEAGAELWVYRERLPPHAWYLHGVFG